MEQFDKINELLRRTEDRALGVTMLEQLTDLEILVHVLSNPQIVWNYPLSSMIGSMMSELILSSNMHSKSEFVDEKGFTMNWEAFKSNGLYTIPSIVTKLMVLDKAQMKWLLKCV